METKYYFYAWWQKADSPHDLAGWFPMSAVCETEHPIEALRRHTWRPGSFGLGPRRTCFTEMAGWHEITKDEFHLYAKLKQHQ